MSEQRGRPNPNHESNRYQSEAIAEDEPDQIPPAGTDGEPHAELARPMIFLPAFQAVEYTEPSAASVQARSMLLRTLIVQASVDPAVLESAIRRAIAEVDPDIHVIRVRPHAEQVSLNFRIERLMARLTSMYGLLALRPVRNHGIQRGTTHP